MLLAIQKPKIKQVEEQKVCHGKDLVGIPDVTSY